MVVKSKSKGSHQPTAYRWESVVQRHLVSSHQMLPKDVVFSDPDLLPRNVRIVGDSWVPLTGWRFHEISLMWWSEGNFLAKLCGETLQTLKLNQPIRKKIITMVKMASSSPKIWVKSKNVSKKWLKIFQTTKQICLFQTQLMIGKFSPSHPPKRTLMVRRLTP